MDCNISSIKELATGYQFCGKDFNDVVLIEKFGRWLHDPVSNDDVMYVAQKNHCSSVDAIIILLES